MSEKISLNLTHVLPSLIDRNNVNCESQTKFKSYKFFKQTRPSVMDLMMDSKKKKWIFGGNHQVSLDQ